LIADELVHHGCPPNAYYEFKVSANPSSAEAAVGMLVVGPFNRVEVDLDMRLEIAHGQVRSAREKSPLYRGFEPGHNGRLVAA
jgi:hypothetical protein